MRGKPLIVAGALLIIAAIVMFVHPQWEGRDKQLDVAIAGKQLEVTTRSVTDIPPLFSSAILVMGVCVAALGAISLPKK